MNPELIYLLKLLAVTGVVTVLLRAFPFLVFGTGRKPNPLIASIGKMLSPAAIAMLVVYCFGCYARDRIPAEHAMGLAELAAGVTVVLVQLWRKNPLLSIIIGTAVYMVLVQRVIP